MQTGVHPLGEEIMSLIGLDFGTHTTSLALWQDEKDTTEVVADDLGSRTIPCTVAYRGDEIIVGQAASSQQHKNALNTFEDIRSMLLDASKDSVHVPQLEKDITVQELGSHFFRNIHNQIKQQVGKAVRDCVISVPRSFSVANNLEVQKRLIESAQAGGIRIKSMIDDATSTLMAYGFDDAEKYPSAKVLVVDIGWSLTDISLYNVSSGLLFYVNNLTTTEICGKVLVKNLEGHCSKDFERKAKVSCLDNKKSMIRLNRECEAALKALSTGTEATIDIDSLCEGMDYSTKISRARFEDLQTIPFMQLKKAITDLLTKNKVDTESISDVCMAGGFTAVPRILASIKATFPNANFPRGRFEYSEAQCIGAALHGSLLSKQGLLDKAPTTSPISPCTTKAIRISGKDSTSCLTVIEANSVLPIAVTVKASAAQESGFFRVLADDSHIADMVFTVEGTAAGKAVPIDISVSLNEEGEINIAVTDATSKAELASLVIPKA